LALSSLPASLSSSNNFEIGSRRARENKDEAMGMTLLELSLRYDMWREVIAEEKRSKLRMVKKKHDP
jgi:hypothetical protein